jgi:uncharacterized membrane protein YdjX (TVP38/TMEM64 family)
VIAFLRRYGLIVTIGALLAGAVASGAWRWFSVGELQAHHAALRAMVAARPLASLALFIVVDAAVISACIPGPGLMATASGYLFGAVLGGLASLAASVIGSSIVCLACRSAFADTLARRGGPMIRRLETSLSRNTFSWLVTVKLVPVLPFFAPNVAAGLAGVRLRVLVAATLVGSAPVCFILAGLGSGLSRALDRGAALDPRLFQSPGVLLPLGLLAFLALASLGVRLVLARRRGARLPPGAC